MIIFSTIKEANLFTEENKLKGKKTGFVPTMGALHEGHLQLMKRAKQENDLLACSIFVNPIQFNNPEDLKKYPRTFESDVNKLESIGCDILFAPDAKEMYPDQNTRVFEFGSLANVMEGKFRPGHFNGVAVVVEKLFQIMEPDRAYFGEKDFQQLAIIRKMVEMDSMPVEIVPCSIVRESDGLAMSSRNARLNPDERMAAPFIYKTLVEARALRQKLSPQEICREVELAFDQHPAFQLEYFEIVDVASLQAVNSWMDSPDIIACIAAFLGQVRLIDNMILFHNFAPA